MENVKTEVKNEQGATKRSIEEVDDNDKNINDRNKRIKAESVDTNTDAVTSDALKYEVENEIKKEVESEVKNERTDENHEKNAEKEGDDDQKKVIIYDQ